MDYASTLARVIESRIKQIEGMCVLGEGGGGGRGGRIIVLIQNDYMRLINMFAKDLLSITML